jgi:hypothetical protein
MHVAGPLVPQPNPFTVEIDSAVFKRYRSSGTV